MRQPPGGEGSRRELREPSLAVVRITPWLVYTRAMLRRARVTLVYCRAGQCL